MIRSQISKYQGDGIFKKNLKKVTTLLECQDWLILRLICQENAVTDIAFIHNSPISIFMLV